MATKRKKAFKAKPLLPLILLVLSILVISFLYQSKQVFKSQAAKSKNTGANCNSSNWDLGCYYTDSGSYYLFGENDDLYYREVCYKTLCRYECVGSLDPGVGCSGYRTWADKAEAEKQEKDKAERRSKSHPKGRTSVLPF